MNRLFVFLLLSLWSQVITLQQSLGQQNDFQGWPSMQVNLEVIKNLKFHLEEEVRFNENISRIDRQINDIGVSYRFSKHLRTAFYYRLEGNWKNSGEHEWRNGAYADLAARLQPGRFTLGYRLRIQSSKVELRDNEDLWFDGIRNRHKISVDYNIKGIPLEPFGDGELFTHLGGSNGSALIGYRVWLGAKWSFNAMHEVSLKYGVEQELHVNDPVRSYIIALGYALNLKLSSVK